MWYFAWVLGLGLALMFAILNGLWLETTLERAARGNRFPYNRFPQKPVLPPRP